MARGRSLPPLSERHGDDTNPFLPKKHSERSPVKYKDAIEGERQQDRALTEGQCEWSAKPLMSHAVVAHTA